MKKYTLLAALAFSALTVTATPKENTSQGNPQEMDKFITELMGKMTLHEKIGQLNLPVTGNIVTGQAKSSDVAGKIRNGEVGGLFNLKGVKNIREVQKLAVENSRLGIPLLFGMDVIHGYETVFPIPLALSCSWDMEAIEKSARIAAIESSADGICWTFSQMVDICSAARWGRVSEGNGEDPFLGSAIAQAMIRGYQGKDMSANNEIMACVKHFALYGAGEAGRDYNTVDMSRNRMFNEYFPPYKAAVEAGVGSAMTSFNEIDGVPATANHWLLTDVLRNQWVFDGFLVTDYTAISEMIDHGIGDLQEVSARALTAGTDMDMVADGFIGTLEKSLKEGKVTEADIDKACRRILEAKYKLGLFEDPYRYLNLQRYQREIHTDEARQLSREIARECQVLLKNEASVLPLSKSAKIALVGPFAVAAKEMQGSWSFSRFADGCVTFLEGMQEAVTGHGGSVTYAEGCWVLEDKQLEQDMVNQYLGAYKPGQVIKPVHTRPNEQLVAEAVALARRSDVVVAALGELNNMNGEGVSRSDITLGLPQVELLKALKATGKPVILILTAGRPLALTETEPLTDAILYTWSLGDQAGRAMADVVFGDVNPSARLSTSFPRNVGQCPIYYNHKNTGRPHQDGAAYSRFNSNYLDCIHGPLYAFGHGLSYTTFEYSDVTLSNNESTADGQVKASVTVTNTGKREGKEVVQLYVRDIYATSSRPVKELKGFEKISLKAGESKTVSFEIGRKQLEYYNHALQLTVEPGDFEIMIGHDSQHVNKAKLTVN